MRLGVEPGKCVFLQGIQEMELPVAHAEGKFVVRDEDVFERMEASGQLVMRYAQSGARTPRLAAENREVPYPANPNGAMGDVAGICDATGACSD